MINRLGYYSFSPQALSIDQSIIGQCDEKFWNNIDDGVKEKGDLGMVIMLMLSAGRKWKRQ